TNGGTSWSTDQMPWGSVHTLRYLPSDPSIIFAATASGLYRKAPAGSTIPQSIPFNINGLKSGDPTWNRNSGSNATCSSSAGTNQYYRVFPFTVSTSGSYTFMMCTPTSDWDAHASLFQNAFDGSNPCGVPSNHLYSDDDANSGGNCNNDPMFTVSLSTGITYYLVSTSYNNLVTGNYQWTFTGPSGATLTNNEASWMQVPTVTTECFDAFFKEGDDTKMFVLKTNGTKVEFWKSSDSGVTFSSSLTGWPTISTTSGRMTTTAANPNRLYAVLLGTTAPNDIPYIMRSNDAGANWTVMCTGVTGLTGSNSTLIPLGMSNGQGFYDLDIIASPTNADLVIAASTTAYRSTDGGATFTPLGGYHGSFGIHPDIQEMLAINGDTWIATDGGINYSTDFFAATANFTPRFKGIYSSDMWGFGQGWNEDIVGGGRYHNGNTALSEQYADGEAIRLGGGEQATGYYMIGRPRHIAFSDILPKIIPTTRNGALVDFTFSKFPNEDGYGNDMSEIEFLPHCYGTVYTGNGNDFWRSTDGGLSWTSLHTFTGRVKEFEISRSNPNVIYLATNTPTQLQKSSDGGVTWTAITLPSGGSMYRASLALSYTNENTLWFVSPSNSSGNRVFKTTDGGASWVNLTTSTINGQAYTAIVHQQGTDNGVYILGDNGVAFYKSDSEADWVQFNTGLPKVHNNEHIKPFYRDSKLRSAGNQGIWEIDFYEEAAPIAQPTVDKLSTYCGRDTFYFDDYSVLNHASATWSWSFPGANYVSSTTVRNPKVTYPSIGTYDVSLTVTNPNGSSTKTLTGIINVIANECLPDTIPGKALTLTASTDYAVQKSALNVTTNNLTLSAWIKPAGIQVDTAGIIFSANSGATGLNFRSANQLGYHWADQASTYGWTGGPTVPANEWSHVALVVKDGAGTNDTATVYLNGVPAFRVGTHNPITFASAFQLGRDRTNSSRNYVGQMDEVVMYDRALTTAEIRELMNLTRNNPNTGSMPGNDANLKSYYQFNELLSPTPYDKVGPRHLSLVGGANITATSTAPVGGGRFHRMAVTTGGAKTFTNASLRLTFPASGPYPNGEMVATRLNVPSDQLCAGQILPDPAGYWVLRNYGTNATFSQITETAFLNVPGVTPFMSSQPNAVQLYRRNHNQDGSTWGSSVDDADAVTHNAGVGNVTFNFGYNSGWHQFEMGLNPVVFPLELLDFQARLTAEHSGLLTWTSQLEQNFKGYFIEHSTDGIRFETLGFVAGKGGGDYVFTHLSLKPGTHYYRLKMEDTNGEFRYSGLKTLQYLNDVGDISVYPNPNTDGWFYMEIQATQAEHLNVVFANAEGRVLHSFEVNDLKEASKRMFHLPFPPGVYLMTITPDNGLPVQKRLVIAE
ncbi:MAG: T9SS type A sorting domain-containing protein, partial [Saprospiraceae bacterium]|nr:T9SS type A sorting domain-containing protein [Saprospiraceae bacterium]